MNRSSWKYFLFILNSTAIWIVKAQGNLSFCLYCKSCWHGSSYDNACILCFLDFQNPRNTLTKFCYSNPHFISVCIAKFKSLKPRDSEVVSLYFISGSWKCLLFLEEDWRWFTLGRNSLKFPRTNDLRIS